MQDFSLERWASAFRYPFSVLARRITRGQLNPIILRALASRHYQYSNTLVVAGGPRSGTTWLAELVCAAVPRSAMLFEPLHIGNVPAAAAAGFTWRTYMKPDEVWPEGKAFLRQALEGKVINRHTASHIPLSRVVRPRLWVTKFIHANLLLGWLAKQFPIRAPALIIRHPCATVASRAGQGWKPLTHAPRIPKFLAACPQFEPVLDGLTTVDEFRAALWCIDYYVPLSMPKPYPFHLVTYEQLVREGEKTLSELCQRWDIDISPAAQKQLSIASQTTKKNAAISTGKDPLARWKALLSAEQIDRILQVVKAFGLDFYTDALEPDYTRLAGVSPIRRPVSDETSE